MSRSPNRYDKRIRGKRSLSSTFRSTGYPGRKPRVVHRVDERFDRVGKQLDDIKRDIKDLAGTLSARPAPK